MGRRKKEDVERLTRQFNLESDAQFKLNDKLTELFIRCEKITNKFLYDNSTEKEKNGHYYPMTNKNKIINSILESCIKYFQIHKGDKKKSKFGEDDMLIKHILVRYEPEILKLSEIDNSTKASKFDMSIKNEPRPEPTLYPWEK